MALLEIKIIMSGKKNAQVGLNSRLEGRDEKSSELGNTTETVQHQTQEGKDCEKPSASVSSGVRDSSRTRV